MDEVDSIARQRGKDGSDTRDSIVNTILVELGIIQILCHNLLAIYRPPHTHIPPFHQS